MKTDQPVLSYKKTVMGSNRSFGLIFGAFFAILALLPLLHGGPLHWWLLGIALAFVAAALCVPHLLKPLNWVWFKLGLMLHHIINPIIMAVIFYGAITPMALLLRALGKDLLRVRSRPKAGGSYWIPRDTPAPGSMSKQF
jgi:hypothetical protein